MAVDKSDARVRGMFAQIAPRYDFLNHLLSLGVDVYWRGRTVAKVPPDGDLPILDLCTGTGDLALAYYRAAAGKLRVVGADFCHPMLVIGRGKAAQAQAERLAFVEADAQTLPFPANQFQIVSVAFGLRNVSDTDRGLREMLRVCRPGGRCVRCTDGTFAACCRLWHHCLCGGAGTLITTCLKACPSFHQARRSWIGFEPLERARPPRSH
jgi:demethylmenaquinone methyltransferase/2-methoxy-6-polyprenyl-1,4-benzoquinol methylase